MTWPVSLVQAALAQPAFLYNGLRRIVQGLTWEIETLPDLDYSDLGYAQNKHKQMTRNYFNPEELERARGVLERRADQSFNAIAVNLRGKAKDSRSQGHCMLSMVISQKKGFEAVEIQYRSTELILKFGADLVFLPYLLEELDLAPNLFRFHFANAFLSGVFFPTACAHWPMGSIAFLKTIRGAGGNSGRYFYDSTRFLLRSSMTEDQFFPFSPENQQHKFAWANLDMKAIRRYLEPIHLKTGKPLPEPHQKSTYVTRRKQREETEE